jgi:tRNA threonylcarbamoyladenosine biosynthesis protein TsaB
VKLLAFDTSHDATVVGLQSGHAGSARHPGGPAASTHLLPAVQALLGEAGLTVSDLDLIGFGAGPGSFTGVRTACSVAQGLGFGGGVPVLAIDSLMALAETACDEQPAPDGLAAWCTSDARMGEVYWAVYQWQAGEWQVLQPPRVSAPQDLLAAWNNAARADAWPCGPGWALPALAATTHSPKALQGVSAAALLRLAARGFGQGLAMPAAQAQPHYVRNKVAQTTDERRAGRPQAQAGASR